MEELEKFLMHDESLDIWPENVMASIVHDDDHINLNFDDFDFINEGEFDSENFSFFEEDEFAMHHELPFCFMNNEEQNKCLSHQYSQLEQHHEKSPSPPPPPPPQQQQQQQKQKQNQRRRQEEEEVEEEEEEEQMNDTKSNEINSKNLVSERNRRNRLNKQLFTLRSIVPNITKMDKRSILVDALAYLQSILQQIEREMEKNDLPSDSSPSKDFGSSFVEDETLPIPIQTQEYDRCAALPAISEMEVEMLDEERFLLQIGFNKAMGALGQVHRMIEMLGLEITCISINENNQGNMQIMAFLRVKKKGVMTQEKLLHRAKENATQLGLLPLES